MTTTTVDPSISPRTSRLILLSVCIGQIIVGLDQRALLVALPTLTSTFEAAFTTIQWTILVYDLILIGLIITMGRLGDLFGRRLFYSIGFLIFVTASGFCGLAQSAGQLIFFRGLQAIGGSMIAANGRAIVSVNLPPEERGRALGITSTAFHLGFLTGPSLGGFLIDSIGWRWIFYINLPLGLWGAYLAWKVVPETRLSTKIAVDIPGALLLLLTNSLLIYAIDQLPRTGWHHPIFLLAASLSIVALFFLLRVEAKAQMPILILSMFRSRLFSGGIVSLFLISGTLSAINFLPGSARLFAGSGRLDHRRRLGDHHDHGADCRRALGSPRLAPALYRRMRHRRRCAMVSGQFGSAFIAVTNHFSPGDVGRRLGVV
jgi:MFS family permease